MEVLIYGRDRLKTLIGIETVYSAIASGDDVSRDRLKTLIGIETSTNLCSQLFRRSPVCCRDRLKTLIGIETCVN